AVGLHPDGERIVVGDQRGIVSVMEWRTGKRLATFVKKPTYQWIWSVAIDPKGKYVAAGGKGRFLAVFDLASGKLVHALKRKPPKREGYPLEDVMGVAWLDADRFVSVTPEGEIIAWSVKTGKALKAIDTGEEQQQAVAVIDGDRVVTGSHTG